MKFIYLLTSLGTKSQSKKEDSEHQEKDVKTNVISIIDPQKDPKVPIPISVYATPSWSSF